MKFKTLLQRAADRELLTRFFFSETEAGIMGELEPDNISLGAAARVARDSGYQVDVWTAADHITYRFHCPAEWLENWNERESLSVSDALIVIPTPKALATFTAKEITDCMERFRCCDWGTCCDMFASQNDVNLFSGNDNLIAVYPLPAGNLWFRRTDGITEALTEAEMQ